RGAFIVLEGLDRSGKTTQVKLLQEKLAGMGRAVELARFPGMLPVSLSLSFSFFFFIINTYLTSPNAPSLPDQAIHLLFTANRWEAAPRLTSLLASGTTIICDRYYYSGMVYSAAKHNPALPLSWARSPEVGLPRPDLVVFLDLDGAAAEKRGGWGGERYEKREMQARVRELFWGLKRGELQGVVGAGGASEEAEDLVVVDAGGSVEEVAREIWRVVEARV
ncbi:hypothetical protein M406DRAFT_19190, partial [Cryphonectria parasitica EP155]